MDTLKEIQQVAGMNVIVQTGRVSLRDMKSLYLPPLQEAAHELGAQLVS